MIQCTALPRVLVICVCSHHKSTRDEVDQYIYMSYNVFHIFVGKIDPKWIVLQ
jgi:hypothetical protein